MKITATISNDYVEFIDEWIVKYHPVTRVDRLKKTTILTLTIEGRKEIIALIDELMVNDKIIALEIHQ